MDQRQWNFGWRESSVYQPTPVSVKNWLEKQAMAGFGRQNFRSRDFSGNKLFNVIVRVSYRCYREKSLFGKVCCVVCAAKYSLDVYRSAVKINRWNGWISIRNGTTPPSFAADFVFVYCVRSCRVLSWFIIWGGRNSCCSHGWECFVQGPVCLKCITNKKIDTLLPVFLQFIALKMAVFES